MPTNIRFILLLAGAFAVVTPARAQNDWQFPDPYFGAIEFGKSRNVEADPRPRAEIAPAPRPASRPRPPRRGYRSERSRRVSR